MGTNNASIVANASVIAILDSRMGNNIVSIENAPVIGIVSNYLKRIEETDIWKFSRLSSVEVEKISSLAIMWVIIPFCKGWNY